MEDLPHGSRELLSPPFEPPSYIISFADDGTLQWDPPSGSLDLALALSYHFPLQKTLEEKMQVATAKWLKQHRKARPPSALGGMKATAKESEDRGHGTFQWVSNLPETRTRELKPAVTPSFGSHVSAPSLAAHKRANQRAKDQITMLAEPMTRLEVPGMTSWRLSGGGFAPGRRKKREYSEKERKEVGRNRGMVCEFHRAKKTKCDPNTCSHNKLRVERRRAQKENVDTKFTQSASSVRFQSTSREKGLPQNVFTTLIATDLRPQEFGLLGIDLSSPVASLAPKFASQSPESGHQDTTTTNSQSANGSMSPNPHTDMSSSGGRSPETVNSSNSRPTIESTLSEPQDFWSPGGFSPTFSKRELPQLDHVAQKTDLHNAEDIDMNLGVSETVNNVDIPLFGDQWPIYDPFAFDQPLSPSMYVTDDWTFDYKSAYAGEDLDMPAMASPSIISSDYATMKIGRGSEENGSLQNQRISKPFIPSSSFGQAISHDTTAGQSSSTRYSQPGPLEESLKPAIPMQLQPMYPISHSERWPPGRSQSIDAESYDPTSPGSLPQEYFGTPEEESTKRFGMLETGSNRLGRSPVLRYAHFGTVDTDNSTDKKVSHRLPEQPPLSLPMAPIASQPSSAFRTSFRSSSPEPLMALKRTGKNFEKPELTSAMKESVPKPTGHTVKERKMFGSAKLASPAPPSDSYYVVPQLRASPKQAVMDIDAGKVQSARSSMLGSLKSAFRKKRDSTKNQEPSSMSPTPSHASAPSPGSGAQSGHVASASPSIGERLSHRDTTYLGGGGLRKPLSRGRDPPSRLTEVLKPSVSARPTRRRSSAYGSGGENKSDVDRRSFPGLSPDYGGSRTQLSCSHENCSRHKDVFFNGQEDLDEHIRTVHSESSHTSSTMDEAFTARRHHDYDHDYVHPVHELCISDIKYEPIQEEGAITQRALARVAPLRDIAESGVHKTTSPRLQEKKASPTTNKLLGELLSDESLGSWEAPANKPTASLNSSTSLRSRTKASWSEPQSISQTSHRRRVSSAEAQRRTSLAPPTVSTPASKAQAEQFPGTIEDLQQSRSENDKAKQQWLLDEVDQDIMVAEKSSSAVEHRTIVKSFDGTATFQVAEPMHASDTRASTPYRFGSETFQVNQHQHQRVPRPSSLSADRKGGVHPSQSVLLPGSTHSSDHRERNRRGERQSTPSQGDSFARRMMLMSPPAPNASRAYMSSNSGSHALELEPKHILKAADTDAESEGSEEEHQAIKAKLAIGPGEEDSKREKEVEESKTLASETSIAPSIPVPFFQRLQQEPSAPTPTAAAGPPHKSKYQPCVPCSRRKVYCDQTPRKNYIPDPNDPTDSPPPCVRCEREGKGCFLPVKWKQSVSQTRTSLPATPHVKTEAQTRPGDEAALGDGRHVNEDEHPVSGTDDGVAPGSSTSMTATYAASEETDAKHWKTAVTTANAGDVEVEAEQKEELGQLGDLFGGLGLWDEGGWV